MKWIPLVPLIQIFYKIQNFMHKKTKQRQITHNRARHIKDQCQGIANEGCLQKASRLSISQLMIELGWIPMGDERIAGGSLEAQPFLV